MRLGRCKLNVAAKEYSLEPVRSFLNVLILLQSHLRLYGNSNQVIGRTTDRLLGFLETLLIQNNEITIYVGRHAFIFDEQLIDRSNRAFEAFANRLFQHGIAAITFSRGVTGEQIQIFLNMVSRKSASSRDEGGFGAALILRQVHNITVREMSELDFSVEDEPVEGMSNEGTVSPLWQRFALSIAHSLHLKEVAWGEEELSPGELGKRANRQVSDSDAGGGDKLAKDLSRFVLSLKHENVRIYRTAALNSLLEFVNSLSSSVRDLFLRNVFNLNIEADLSEGLLHGMSDETIMNALRNASMEKDYAPPVVLQLLGRLAGERGMAAPQNDIPPKTEDSRSESIDALFRQDDFDKFVPERYQKALISIIKSKALPSSVTENLVQLKRTLEPDAVDHHVGEILFQLLKEPISQNELESIRNNFKMTIDLYLRTHNYQKISELLSLCRSEHHWNSVTADFSEYFSSGLFTSTLLDDLIGLDQERSKAVSDLLVEIREPVIAPLLDCLSIENNRSVRRLYLNLLTRFGNICIPQIVSRLGDKRWYVVRNLLYLLRELGSAEVLPYVRPLIKHPHAKVSQEALKICFTLRDKEAVPFLLALLDGENEGELIQAVSHAAFCDDPAVLRRLVVMLKMTSVLNYYLELKKAIVRALASSVPQKTLQVFAGILGTNHFLHRKQQELLKLEVINLLEKIPGDEARRLLGEQAAIGSGVIMKTAQAALDRLNGR